MESRQGKLFVVGTPIGNLEDITLRAIRILKEADFCLVEDTRHTKNLFSKYEIKTKMISHFRQNEDSRINFVISEIESGKQIALVSDAGMPGISDPGEKLIRTLIERGLIVEVIPGPSSPIMAIILSGMRTDRFSFFGFIPRKGSKRNKILKKIAGDLNPTIIFESPLRLESLLKDTLRFCGDRNVSICRELTKIHEQTVRGKISEILDMLDKKKLVLKGEIVIVLEGNISDEPCTDEDKYE